MSVKYKPLGARLLVEPLVTTLSLEERAKNAGLEIVVEHDNRPRPTQGIVIALGPDSLMREQIKEGDTVFFAPYAGSNVTLLGKEYRQLEYPEITGVMTMEEPLAMEESMAMTESLEAPPTD